MSRGLKNALLVPLRKSTPERYVLIHYRVATMIEAACMNCANQPESGGILLGSIRGPHLEISGFTRPGPEDQRAPFHFVRQDAKHQSAAERAWASSQRTITFVGEWHTHPIGKPIPSSIDRKSWSALARRTKHPMLFLLAAPAKWTGFLANRRLLMATLKELSLCERGHSGIILR